MSRIVFWILIGLLFWLLVRGLLQSRKRSSQAPPHPAPGEDMVSCAICGVNLPRSEARLESGKFVCVDNPQCLR